MADLIETFYRNAQLSDAAYADLAVGMSQDLYIQALRDRGFSALQATEFASRYSVLSTFSNSATGFSATLFQVNGTNEKILAIRGTDDWRDLLITDVLQIGLLGLANQYTDLKTFYLQLTVEGKLLSTDALTVTGHSLGGYLAQAFTVDHPLTVSHAYTYNAPGFGGLLINPFSALGIAGAPVQTPLITNVIAQGQSFVASTGRQLGVPEHVFIETSLNPLTNHGVRSLSDSLALYALFAKVDPNVSVSDVTNILNAASSVVANSLESGLDALRQILQGPTVSTTPIDNYEAYYTNLIALRDNLPTVSSYRVDSLVTQSSSTVYSQAKSSTADGLAYRYALQELNPFAIVGVDYGVHNPVGANGGPLDLYNTQTGHGTMTALFLSDRAELLARKNEVNVNDGGLIAGLSSDTRFLDIRTGFEFGSTLTAANDVIFGDDRVGDAISGRGGDDHLYGGDGADTIEGHDGSDYIEGNAGNDPLLSGGAGNDIILGQQGNDTLDGGADNDRLNGGLGDDTLKGGEGADQYTYFTGQGNDTVNDSDKSGSILFDRQTLVGGIRRQGTPAETWVSPDAQFTFVKFGTSLVVNNVITIENFDFTNGALGIKLADAGNLVDSVGPVINYNNGQPSIRYDGDATDNTPIFTAAANHEAYGYGGNDILDFESGSALYNHQLFGGDGHDELHAGSGNDRVYGGEGSDWLTGWPGNDVLDGGNGVDVLHGGFGQDVLYGGAGNDGLNGEDGDDVLWGGEGNDSLVGEAVNRGATTIGDDYLDGEAGDDWLAGLRGDDVLYGGVGADHLYGDQVTSEAPNFEWTYPGIVTVLPMQAFNSVTGGADYLDGEAGDDYLQGDAGDDVLFGGADNDQLWGDDQQTGVIEEGDDWLEGEAGNDQLVGGGGEDALFGGDGDDVLVGDYANNPILGFDDTLDGGAGIDQLQGGGGNDLLDGGTENDTLFGDDGDDSLYGGTGNDQLQGGEGDDVLVGEEGVDLIFGQAGDDLLFGDEGNDQLSGGAGFDDLAGGAGDDVLFGGDDDDTLFGDEGADELQGGAGSDVLVGDVGNDRLYGDAGADTLWGDEGGDQLTGGTGNDIQDGGAGSDIYVFNVGDGQDVIYEETRLGDLNTIQFGAGITLAMLTLTPDDAQHTLLIQVGGGGDSILVNGFTNTGVNGTGGMQNLAFADGGVSSLADPLGLPSGTITGSSGDDVIRTGDGDDTIQAGGGNDTVTSNGGNDQLFGGAGNDVLTAGDGDDTLSGGDGTDVLLGGLGNDLLDGGAGNDRLNSGAGNDTFVFGIGSGVDTVDAGGASAGDTVQLLSGVTPGNLLLERNGNNLIFNIAGTTDRLSFTNFYSASANQFDTVTFSDGTTWDRATTLGQVRLITGNEQANNLQGTALDETLSGFGGTDDVRGGAGNDYLLGGAGDDYVDGEDGDDILEGGAGRDFIYGGSVNFLQSGGNDTLLFGYGDGIDRVMDFGFYAGEVDTIRMDDGISPGNVAVTRDGGQIYLSLNAADQVWLNGFYSNSQFFDNNGIRVQFSDGTVWDSVALRNMTRTISGTEGTDSLRGFSFFYIDEVLDGKGGNDRLEGRRGADILRGGTGADTYVFSLGDEQDVIEDAPGEGNRVFLSDVLDAEDFTWFYDQTMLGFAYGPYGDQIRFAGFDSAHALTSLGVETVEFADGTTAALPTLLAGQTIAVAGTDQSETLLGTKLKDRITGGLGHDTLRGGAGDDTYVFNLGDGTDVIVDVAETGSGNLLLFGPGVTLGDLDFVQGPSTLDISVGTQGDRVRLEAFDPTGVAGTVVVETIRFTDGSTYFLAPLLQQWLLSTGTEADDVLIGGPLDDFMNARAGNDLVEGREGNDTLLGGNGQDTLHGEAGDDQLYGGADADTLMGGEGNDLLAGGEGADQLTGGGGDDALSGGSGSDTYFYALGDGHDVIDDLSSATEQNTVVFDPGIDPSAVRFEAVGSVAREFGTSASTQVRIHFTDTDSLTLTQFDPTVFDLSFSPRAVDRYVFADGTVLLYEQIAARGFDILGTNGNDDLVGTVGDDRLVGGPGIDQLYAWWGNNLLDGGPGDDVLWGGAGYADTYVFRVGDGHDTIRDDNFFNVPEQANRIAFGPGIASSDLTFLRDGLDLLIRVGTNGDALSLYLGGLGYRTIQTLEFADGVSIDITNILNTPLGATASETITGTSGNDTIFGGGGNDTLNGGLGNDILVAGSGGTTTLSGGAGNDTLFGGSSLIATFSGGTGNDILFASSGSNVFVMSLGDGRDTIQIPSYLASMPTSTVQFAGGYNTFNPSLGLGSLVIRYGTLGDELHIVNFDPNDVFASPVVQRFEFTDRVLTYEDLIALGFDISGTSGNDVLTGTNTTDRFLGLAGDDQLSGGDGTDTFTGGTGNDTLRGGAGNDAYMFNLGDGIDTIEDVDTVGESNRIQFGSGIANSDLVYTEDRIVHTLTIQAGSSGTDKLLLTNFDPTGANGSLVVETLNFVDGSTVNLADLFPPIVNHAPTLANALADRLVQEDAPFSLVVPSNTFADQDAGDALTLSASLADGSALPAWLSFDAASATFSGTPDDAQVGSLDLKITATDRENLNVSDVFTLGVTNVNEVPTVAVPLANQTALEDTAFTFAVPGSTFADVDPGDVLTYSTALADGTSVPSWLSFDPSTRTFSGTPLNSHVGTLALTVTATDQGNLSVSTGFTLAIQNVNDAPTVASPLADQTVQEDAPFTIQVPANTFADQDAGDVLTLSASLADGTALPSWLSFNPTTRTFSGTPNDAQVGTLDLHVMATDTGNVSVSDSVTLTVNNVNEAPTVAVPLADQQATEDAPFSVVAPAGTFADVDSGDTFTYSATLANGAALPPWLSFNPVTRTLSGTPLNGNVGTLAIAVTATDTGNLSASDTFSLTVTNVNDAPTVAAPLADQQATQGTLFNVVVPAGTFADVDAGDILAYSATLANGATLPTWLSFNPATRTFSGTPQGSDVGTLDVRVTVTDTGNLSVADVFALTIAPSGGTAGNDILIGTNGNDVLDGLAGDDALSGLAGNDTLIGGPGNDTLDGGTGTDTMQGGTGNDTYIVDVSSDVVTELANGGTDTVQSTVTYTLAANVENLTLTGTTAINGTGNALDNLLTGNSGANVLTGGAGNDTYIVGTGDTVVEQAGQGFDTVQSAITWTLGANLEALTLTGTTNITGTGNTLDNILTGNSAANVLTGGAGNDVYVIGAGDTVVEGSNAGTDTVLSDVTTTLSANVELLGLTGTAANNGTGNSLNNGLTGNNAANVLDGGTGADILAGLDGNDTYLVDNTGDTVIELANNGTDLVQSSVTYTLAANVENLTLIGTAAINGTGNTLDNVLTGNSANNTLTGGAGNDTLDGGAGNDTMVGGTGNDTYVVTAAGDVVTENVNEGTDTVQSSITYTLGANVENLTLTGTAAINGTGNSLNNILAGNSGNNTLTGGVGNDTLSGAQGNDILNGGAGNDTYLVNRGDGQETIQDADATAGNADKLLYGTTINPLDLVLSRQANDLRLAIHGGTEQVTIQNWYTSPSTNQVETIQAGNGQTLLSTQVDQLIQAMAGFTQQTGLTWDQAIDQQPQDVQNILAASWQ